jgi:multidrug efflux pump
MPQVSGGLVRTRGQPFAVVLGGRIRRAGAVARQAAGAMEQNPGSGRADSDYKETRPQMRVEIDRQRAADLGVRVERSAMRWKR